MLDDLDKKEGEIGKTDNLFIPFPEKNIGSFLPERDISPEELENIKLAIKSLIEKSSITDTFILDRDLSIECAADLIIFTTILNPDFTLKVDDSVIDKYREGIQYCWEHNNWIAYCWSAFACNYLKQSVHISINNFHKEQMKREIQIAAEQANWPKFAEGYFKALIIDRNFDWGITDEYKKRLSERINPNSPIYVTTLKIIDLDIILGDTEPIKSYLETKMSEERNKQGLARWYDFVSKAFQLGILSAKNITFDSRGMHLFFGKKPDSFEQLPDVPEVL